MGPRFTVSQSLLDAEGIQSNLAVFNPELRFKAYATQMFSGMG